MMHLSPGEVQQLKRARAEDVRYRSSSNTVFGIQKKTWGIIAWVLAGAAVAGVTLQNM